MRVQGMKRLVRGGQGQPFLIIDFGVLGVDLVCPEIG